MITVMFVVLGLILGSFICASVWRWHEQNIMKRKKHKSTNDKTYQKDLSIAKGRSMCAHCWHELAAKDLVPLLSWLWLGGKCRYCRQSIGWLEPAAEVSLALLFVVSYHWWPQAFTAQGVFDLAIWLILLCGFVALSIYDIKWFLLPDKLVAPLTIVAALKVLTDVIIFGSGVGLLANSVSGAALIAGLFYGLFAVSKGAWIGGGDVKMAAMLGLLAGSPLKALLVIFVSSLLGLLASVPLFVQHKATRTSQIPFGPFLLAATVIIVLFGDRIVQTYEVLFALN